MPCPQYEIRNTKYGSKNCNIFTIVEGDEGWVMRDEWKIRIKLLTSWIIMAFSAIAPKWTGARMGAAFLDRQIRPIQPLPLNDFSPTSENLFLFLPDLSCRKQDDQPPTAPSRLAPISQPSAPKVQRSGILRLVFGILRQGCGILVQDFFLIRQRFAPLRPYSALLKAGSAPIQPDSAPIFPRASKASASRV